MDRRTFLIGLGLSSFAAAAGGVWLLISGRETLCTELELLLDPSFKKISMEKDANILLSELKRKGVIAENGLLDPSVIEKLAETDEMVSFDGYFYTQTELEVYTLAFLLQGNCDL